MAKRSKAETERFYRRLLADQARSGLSIRAFARVRGVPAGTLSAWKHELRKRDAQVRAEREPSRPRFVPVRVVDAGAQGQPPHEPGSLVPGGYEVCLGAGRVLRVPRDFDEARVAALVRAVASC